MLAKMAMRFEAHPAHNRRGCRRLIVVGCLLLCAVSFWAKEETLDELKAHFENARPEDRVELGIRIAQKQLLNADRMYLEGKVDAAREAVEDIVNYARRAADVAVKTKKRLKNTEIDVRRISDKLRDIKRTLAFEDQAPVDAAIHHLEELRTSLLSAMFRKDEKKS
jgi:hypothetical protein